MHVAVNRGLQGLLSQVVGCVSACGITAACFINMSVCKSLARYLDTRSYCCVRAVWLETQTPTAYPWCETPELLLL